MTQDKPQGKPQNSARNATQNFTTEHPLQFIEGDALQTADIARICCVSTEWLHERIEQEVIYAEHKEGQYYFSTTMVTRVRDVAHIEKTYDADPQLAALVADLMEQVRRLKAER